MASEQQILAAAIMDRDAYDTLQAYAGFDEFSPIAQHWLEHLEEYYDRDPHVRMAERTLLRSMGLAGAAANHHELLATYYDGLPLIGISSANVVASILEYKRTQVGLQLATRITDPESSPDRITPLVERYAELLSAETCGSISLDYVDYDSFGEFFDPEKIIPLFPQSIFKHKLNGGGALPGHHILIYGRPEMGKSLFAIYQAAAIASKGYKVLYCANEEDPHIHAARATCCMINKPIKHFERHQDEYIRRARKRGLDNIRFLKLEPGTIAEIELGIREFEPAVVILDQLGGLDVGESNPVQHMDKAARQFRTLVGKHGLVGISVAQAGDRTERYGQEPPAWLTMSDVYGSRTGLPAQVDLMIGIGADEDMRSKSIRAISLPKNKLGGNHEGFRVRMDFQSSRCNTVG